MKRSVDRILTTHVGSLPRPPDLLEFLEARETGRPVEQAAFDGCLAASVHEIVRKQVAAGIDSVCDGELGKISYTFYVRHRLSGIGVFRGGDNDKPPQTAAHRDLLDHPDFHQRLNQKRGGTSWFSREAVPCCIGPVAYEDRRPLAVDLANLAEACAAAKPIEAFMNAASPGVLTKFVPDRYYRDEDAYVEALADALKEEYEAIHHAGLILQIDAPDLGSARHNQYQHLSDDEFLRIAERNIAALNHATANIPPEAMRMHLCWGNYEGPHTHDIPLAKIIDVAMRARPAGLSFEAANPRHAHEWEDLRGRQDPRRQGADPRGDQLDDQFRRASAADRAADRELRRSRRPRAGDRRSRLRLCHLRLCRQRGRPLGGMGQARRPRRRRAHRQRPAVGLRKSTRGQRAIGILSISRVRPSCTAANTRGLKQSLRA